MKVLILENINPSAVNLYKQNEYEYIHLKSSLSEIELTEQIKDVDVRDILGREIVKPKIKLLTRNFLS